MLISSTLNEVITNPYYTQGGIITSILERASPLDFKIECPPLFSPTTHPPSLSST